MTSQINFDAIDITFPVPGQDNDSQGFRGNFAAIQSGLEQAKSEITDLQVKSVLKETLGSSSSTVANDLLGSTIKNGLYSNFNGLVPDDGMTTFTGSQHTIHFSGVSENSGALQVFKISQDSLITFANWRNDPVQFTSMRLHLLSNGESAWNVQFSNNGGNVVFDQANGIINQTIPLVGYTPTVDEPVHTVVDVWSYDGDTVYMRVLGNYTTIGQLVTQFGNVTVTGSFIGSSTTDSSSAITGAVKVAGGVGIAKNLFVGQDLRVTNTDDAVSKTTGALAVAGGVGIAKKLYVGGNVELGTTLSNNVVIKGDLIVEGNSSLATTSVNIANINDIANVDTISSPLSANQILKYNGSAWINTSNTLNDITDVNISLPATGDSLKYDGNTLTWTNNLDLVEYTITVADNGSGTQEVFFIDGQALLTSAGEQFDLEFRVGRKYRFDLGDASNTNAPLRFSTTPDTAVPSSITAYTEGVTVQGTAGSAGAYVEIRITDSTPKVLFLYAPQVTIDTSLIGGALPISVGSWYYTGTEELADEGVVSPGKSVSYFSVGTAEQVSILSDGKDGQVKSFMVDSGTTGTMTMTVVNAGWGGAGTITFEGVGVGCTVQFINNKWFCIGNNGAVFA